MTRQQRRSQLMWQQRMLTTRRTTTAKRVIVPSVAVPPLAVEDSAAVIAAVSGASAVDQQRLTTTKTVLDGPAGATRMMMTMTTKKTRTTTTTMMMMSAVSHAAKMRGSEDRNVVGPGSAVDLVAPQASPEVAVRDEVVRRQWIGDAATRMMTTTTMPTSEAGPVVASRGSEDRNAADRNLDVALVGPAVPAASKQVVVRDVAARRK